VGVAGFRPGFLVSLPATAPLVSEVPSNIALLCFWIA
jgi:hypothetical protein